MPTSTLSEKGLQLVLRAVIAGPLLFRVGNAFQSTTGARMGLGWRKVRLIDEVSTFWSYGRHSDRHVQATDLPIRRHSVNPAPVISNHLLLQRFKLVHNRPRLLTRENARTGALGRSTSAVQNMRLWASRDLLTSISRKRRNTHREFPLPPPGFMLKKSKLIISRQTLYRQIPLNHVGYRVKTSGQ